MSNEMKSHLSSHAMCSNRALWPNLANRSLRSWSGFLAYSILSSLAASLLLSMGIVLLAGFI